MIRNLISRLIYSNKMHAENINSTLILSIVLEIVANQ